MEIPKKVFKKSKVSKIKTMNYKDMKFKMWTGCDRGLCHQACGRSDKQLNTFDWLEDIPGNTDTTDLVEVQF